MTSNTVERLAGKKIKARSTRTWLREDGRVSFTSGTFDCDGGPLIRTVDSSSQSLIHDPKVSVP